VGQQKSFSQQEDAVILFEPPTAQLAIKRLLGIPHGIEIFLFCGALDHFLGIHPLSRDYFGRFLKVLLTART
jgi:hypothetical protein